ncbi:uncharacterized protein LOC123015805 [Tribolium madens]|uniref:uncharacterized protein LOC123015805 n=1 Tax=Tribolium madens TaxID=41895 RepID=UPI001CF745C3|nr:uncharacterized protein LOC123015805 [Tribolium madens]
MENKKELRLHSNIEDYLSKANLYLFDVEEQTAMFKSRINFYKEEIAKMESALSRLHLIEDQSKILEEPSEVVKKLANLQNKFDLKELTPNAVVLSHVDKLKERNNYSAKLKICIKMYIQLNEELTKKIQHLKSEHKKAENTINNIVTATPDDLKTMEVKINRYENALTKLEKKYPWLRNEKYSLVYFSKEINLLISAKKEKEELVKELSPYHGLKPDLQEASEQLAQIKCEYEAMSKKLMN